MISYTTDNVLFIYLTQVEARQITLYLGWTEYMMKIYRTKHSGISANLDPIREVLDPLYSLYRTRIGHHCSWDDRIGRWIMNSDVIKAYYPIGDEAISIIIGMKIDWLRPFREFCRYPEWDVLSKILDTHFPQRMVEPAAIPTISNRTVFIQFIRALHGLIVDFNTTTLQRTFLHNAITHPIFTPLLNPKKDDYCREGICRWIEEFVTTRQKRVVAGTIGKYLGVPQLYANNEKR